MTMSFRFPPLPIGKPGPAAILGAAPERSISAPLGRRRTDV